MIHLKLCYIVVSYVTIGVPNKAIVYELNSKRARTMTNLLKVLGIKIYIYIWIYLISEFCYISIAVSSFSLSLE